MDYTDGDQTVEKDHSKTIKTPIPITIDANGEPGIPSATVDDGYNAKAIQSTLRDYCTAHIRELFNTIHMALLSMYAIGSISGKKKATIPWAKVSMDPTAWIDEECYPPGFQWADPSKIWAHDVFRLLDHWRQQKQAGLSPLIWNPSCELLVDTAQQSEHVQNQRQRQSSSSSDSNDEEDNYAEELARIPEHSDTQPSSPSPRPTWRGANTSETEDIGEADNGSPPFQVSPSVRQPSCKPYLLSPCHPSHPTYCCI